MDKILEFGLLSFTSIFTMINPLGVMPVFTSLTTGMSTGEARQVAVKAVLTALFTMILFAISGKFIFDFFHISVNSLRVVGGIIFFMAGFDMLQARLIRTKENSKPDPDYGNDIAITPLGIPMICGPGAITASIVLMNDADLIAEKFLLLIAILLVLIITWFFLIGSRQIMRLLGDSGNKVLMRVMGLIVMVIAVEFLFSGLKPILRDIFNIS
jgi:multiple antibiotic resistance protein